MSELELNVYEMWADASPSEVRSRILELVAEVRRLREREEANFKLLESVKEWFPPEHYAAVTAEKPLAWTKDPPTVPGHWWSRSGPGSQPTMLRVVLDDHGVWQTWLAGSAHPAPIGSVGGEWCRVPDPPA